MTTFRVDNDATLLTFLETAGGGMKRATAKLRLKHGAVKVNGRVVTKHDKPLSPGDEVELHRKGQGANRGPGLRVVKQNKDLVIVDKPAGLLTVATEKGAGERTAVEETAALLNLERPLFPCHRLDRDTSGLLMLTPHQHVQQHFFKHWDEVTKTYRAIVDGHLEKPKGTVKAKLFEHPYSLAVMVSDGRDAKDATTHYKELKRGEHRSLVELQLVTGRRHQIRVHLQHLGHPVSGDPRYGTGKKGVRRMCLHSYGLTFKEPGTGQLWELTSRIPKLFEKAIHAPVLLDRR